jgi:Tol biopolymer transport system component/DNA-binding winged helix-turn-helix (wHTH) protein
MMTQIVRKSRFSLEDWIVEPEFNQLSRGNTIHQIEPKVMSVLLKLAGQAQRVISKDEIIRAVWPDTFVGEDALTRCISVLRHILEDDPHHPRFIKTVPKVGYCLLAVARPVKRPPTELPTMESLELSMANESPAQSHPTQSHIETEAILATTPIVQKAANRLTNTRIGVTALAFALACGFTVWIVHTLRAKTIPPTIQTFQLTTNAGEQSSPAWSPDGKRLAFVWAKEDGSRQHIYIKEFGSEILHRLTDLSDYEYSPVWSPDGKQIAFLSSSESGLGLYVASLAATTSVRKVYIPGVITSWDHGALSWSPDGKSFVLVDHIAEQPSSYIYQIDVDTLHAHALTTPPSSWEGDLTPVFSPDGGKIAFLRASESAVADIYWVASQGGEPHQVTHEGKMINGIAWSSDNRSIVFSSNRAGEYALWKVPLEGGTPQRMPVGTESATQPTISQNGNSLAFVQDSAIFGILHITSRNESHDTKESLIVSSTAQDSAPSISPDGKQFAFQSWRSGSQQIWVSSIDGQSLRQVTPTDGNISGSGSPSWSPDGTKILFDSRIDSHAHIFVIAATGGSPQQITYGEVNDIVPRWSADGRSIYFRSNRGGRWQLWTLPATGGAPQPVTSEDGIAGQESPDGKWLYFARGGESGIWRMPTSGGEAVRILDQPPASYWAYWTVNSNGIYFLDQRESSPTISIYDPITKKISLYAKLNRMPPLYSGLSVFHAGQELLISDKHNAGSHVSIAQGAF